MLRDREGDLRPNYSRRALMGDVEGEKSKSYYRGSWFFFFVFFLGCDAETLGVERSGLLSATGDVGSDTEGRNGRYAM